MASTTSKSRPKASLLSTTPAPQFSYISQSNGNCCWPHYGENLLLKAERATANAWAALIKAGWKSKMYVLWATFPNYTVLQSVTADSIAR